MRCPECGSVDVFCVDESVGIRRMRARDENGIAINAEAFGQSLGDVR